MKVALLFPGYSSQFVGMAKELYDESRIMQEYFEEASNCLNINFVKLCFASSESELKKIDHAYPAVFLVSTAIAASIQQLPLSIDVVTGLNIGQFSAVSAAQGLSLPDGLYFLAKYAYFYQALLAEKSYKAFIAEYIPFTVMQDLMRLNANDKAAIAIRYAEDKMMITGEQELLDRLEALIYKEGGSIVRSSVQMGTHSHFMQPVVDCLNVYAQKIDFKEVTIPFITPLDGSLMRDGDRIKKQLMQSITNTLYWDIVMQQLQDYDLCIEVGPGTQLANMTQKKYPEKYIMSINKPIDYEKLKKFLDLQVG